MKKINFRSFKVKFTLILILSMLFAGALSNFLIYKYALSSQFNQLRDKLKVIAQTAALMVDAELLLKVPLNKSGVNSTAYKIIVEKLKKIREVNTPIKYIYTMIKTEREGVWQFAVDPDLRCKQDKNTTSFPGDKYNTSRFPEMLKAFDEASADNELSVDEWGITLSGYAPIRDKEGKAIAMLGVDVLADDVNKMQTEIRRRAIFILFIEIMLSLIAGTFIASKITGPINQLVTGTQNIASGNLQYRVEVKENDEISDLAQSFNKMAGNLYESRKNLHHYFYRIVQSLVRVLEARDHYTKDHSERVAKYAEKVVLKMGFSQESAELIKQAAELHDIGKLKVPEKILNKKEKLTEQEWKLIQTHPIVGSDFLKPVLLDEEILSTIRWHHERYDGKGYPDAVSGENIPLFAQILNVTNAYDAMTSSRAYRPALSKEEAAKEIKKNSGAQFAPNVADVFLKILSEESKEFA